MNLLLDFGLTSIHSSNYIFNVYKNYNFKNIFKDINFDQLASLTNENQFTPIKMRLIDILQNETYLNEFFAHLITEFSS